jgi:hypothetical protein
MRSARVNGGRPVRGSITSSSASGGLEGTGIF